MIKFYKLFFINCSIIFSIQSCSKDDNSSITEPDIIINQPQEAVTFLNVSYGSTSEQVYDIYLPENRTPDTKIIILVHGGGWTSGDKADMNDIKNRMLIDLPDYAIVNINYRLASQGTSPFPMQIDDITAAINHLKNNQVTYNISDEYGFIGVSAGAQLAMLWSYEYDLQNNVNMVASIVGPTNFTDLEYSSIINPTFMFFGITPSETFLTTYSPYHQVQTTSPPTILFYGGMDNLIPSSQGIDMDAKLTDLNVPHEFTFYPDEGHGWTGENLIDTWIKLNAFIGLHH